MKRILVAIDFSEVTEHLIDKTMGLGKAFKANLMIIGSRQHGVWYELLVAMVRNIIHHSPCPVLVIPQIEKED